MQLNRKPRPEFAHYYADWIWGRQDADWMKSLLLFFDGIALAVPPEMATALIESEAHLAQPLMEQGLLRNYKPELWLGTSYIDQVRDFEQGATKIIQWDAASDQVNIIPMRELIKFPAESYFLNNVYDCVSIEVLARAKFLTDAQSGQLGSQTQYMRALLVGITSRMLIQNIKEVAIQPVINSNGAALFVASMIGPPAGNAQPEIVVGDLAEVGIDLTVVPLDEVLDFRKQYGSEYRDYSREIREFVLSLSLMTEDERLTAISARRDELNDRAARLRRIGRESFKRQSVGMGFGIAGAAWTLVHGDPWGAAFAAGATAAGFSRRSLRSVGAAYTYILRAAKELSR